MNPNNEIKAVNDQENALFYSSSEKGYDEACGCIGHLRGDFGRNGIEFYSTFWDHCKKLKTQEFREEFDIIVNKLRDNDSLLDNLSVMAAFCRSHPYAKLNTWDNNNATYGFKVETKTHSYYIRCFVLKGDYNFYVYCYNRSSLLKFLEASESKSNMINKE